MGQLLEFDSSAEEKKVLFNCLFIKQILYQIQIKTRIKICNSTNSILFGFIHLLQVYFTEGDHLHRPIPWETPKTLHHFTIVTGLPFHYQIAQLNKNQLTFWSHSLNLKTHMNTT